MKTFKFILAIALTAVLSTAASAQVVKKTDADRKAKAEKGAAITDRQQSFYEVTPASDADLQWMKIIYRSLDVTKGKNAALYYPEEPNADGQSLFFIIMRLLANNQIAAYEYLDGREMFTDEYRIKVAEMLDRFHIMNTPAKGSTEKNPRFDIENADIPGNEILSWYVIERWEFDTRSNQMKTFVDALCPVMHRTDEFGGEPIKYPMFWVKLNDIRPYMAQQYVFTDDDNNLSRHSLDDFFKLNMYTGEIYKTKNLRNQSLRQQFPEDSAYRHAQDSIERRLKAFNKDLWVPTREELQARAEAKAKLEAEQNGEKTEENATEEKSDDKQAAKRTTKRGSKTTDNKSTKSAKKTTKVKERKPKEIKASSNAVKSVRNRKR